jgi:hypothetical protein
LNEFSKRKANKLPGKYLPRIWQFMASNLSKMMINAFNFDFQKVLRTIKCGFHEQKVEGFADSSIGLYIIKADFSPFFLLP